MHRNWVIGGRPFVFLSYFVPNLRYQCLGELYGFERTQAICNKSANTVAEVWRYFAALFTLAQRFRCAAPIRFRAAVLKVRVGLMGSEPARLPVLPA